MRDRVEVVREIGVHHFARPTIGDAEVDTAQRHLGAHAFAEAVLPGEQVFIEDRSENQQHCHLRDTVADGWDAQRALPAVCLGDPYTQQGRAPVLLGSQLLPQSLQPGRESVFLDALKGLAVHPRRAAVRAAVEVYRSMVAEAKLRLLAVERAVDARTPITGMTSLDAEFCFLQLRKVVELVAFSAMKREEGRYRRLR